MHYVGSWLSTISKTIFWVNNRQNEVKFLFESIAAQRNIYQVENNLRRHWKAGWRLIHQMDQLAFVFATRSHCIKGKQCQLITINNQNMSLCSKQSSLYSFYALPSGGKSKGAVVHWLLKE